MEEEAQQQQLTPVGPKEELMPANEGAQEDTVMLETMPAGEQLNSVQSTSRLSKLNQRDSQIGEILKKSVLSSYIVSPGGASQQIAEGAKRQSTMKSSFQSKAKRSTKRSNGQGSSPLGKRDTMRSNATKGSNLKESVNHRESQPNLQEEDDTVNDKREENTSQTQQAEGEEDVIQPVQAQTPPKKQQRRPQLGAIRYRFCVFPGNYPQYIRDALDAREGPTVEWTEVDACVEIVGICDLVWKPFNFLKNGFDMIDRRRDENPKKPLVYNHFEYISILSTKTGLLKTLREYYNNNCKEAQDAKYKVQDTLPLAYIITSNAADLEFQEFKKKFKQIDRGFYLNDRSMPCKHLFQNYWLLKPSNMNQGKGIEIFNSLKQVHSYLANKPVDMQWVVQKYIEKPLLYNKRKFDIRVLALATNEMELFFYEDGYMRTSSDDYSLDNKSKFIHLTNNCYQKFSTNYEKFEEGNQLSFAQFQTYLDQTFPEIGVSFNEHMLPRIKDLIIDCFVSAINGLNPAKREHCFELMGFDFLIDEDFRVWLIEVNTNPYFGVKNAAMPNFIYNLVDDTFKLTLDRAIKPGYDTPYRKENLYELLYSPITGVNKRRPFNQTNAVYPIAKIREQLEKEREALIQQRQQQQSHTKLQPNFHVNIRSAAPVIQKAPAKPESQAKIHKAFYSTLEGLIKTDSQSQLKNKALESNLKQATVSRNPESGQTNRSKSAIHQTTASEEETTKQRVTTTKFRANNSQVNNHGSGLDDKRVHQRKKQRLPISNINANRGGQSSNNANSVNKIPATVVEQTTTSLSLPRQRGSTADDINQRDPSALSSPLKMMKTGFEHKTNEGPQPLGPIKTSPLRSQPGNRFGSEKQSSTTPQGGGNLSILLKKKADESMRVNQASQAEYLTKIQRMLKVKTLVEQVKDCLIQIEGFEQKRKEFGKIFNQICAIFSTPESHAKKEVNIAMQALKLMMYSQFIIHFNDKGVLVKLLDILRLQGSQYLEIKDAILKNLTEISKHYSIRGALLSRKLLSKIMKSMHDHVNLVLKHDEEAAPLKEQDDPMNQETKILVDQQEDAQAEKPDGKESSLQLKPENKAQPNGAGVKAAEMRVLHSFIGLMVNLASIINTRFYIPGETKEVEALRRKAVMNGILIYVQALITLIIQRPLLSDAVKEAFRRLQVEVLENVELQDFRLHVYTVAHIMKQRIDHNFQGSSFVLQINDQEKANLIIEYASIAQEKLFISLKTTLESIHHSKGLKVKIPSFLDSLSDFLNSEYLKSTFLRYKKLIEQVSQPQTHLINSDGPQRKKQARNLLKHGSQQRFNQAKGGATVTTEPSTDMFQQISLQRQIKEAHIRQTVYGNNRLRSNNRPSIALLYDAKPLKITVDQTTDLLLGENNVEGGARGSYNNSPEKRILTEYDEEQTHQTEICENDLSAIASKNHMIVAQNGFARNPGAILAVGVHPHNLSDGKFTLGHSTEVEQSLVLPVLEPYRKGQPKEVYLQKLQPYLQGSKLVNKPTIPKRVQQLAQLHGGSQQPQVLLNMHQPPKKVEVMIPIGRQTTNAQVLAKAYNQQAYLRRVTRGSNASSGKASIAPTAGGGRNNDSIDHGRSFDNLGTASDPLGNNLDDPYKSHEPPHNRQSLPGGGSQSDRKSPMGRHMPQKLKTPNQMQSSKMNIDAGEYHLPAIQDALSLKNNGSNKKEGESRFMQVSQSIKSGDINTANANAAATILEHIQ